MGFRDCFIGCIGLSRKMKIVTFKDYPIDEIKNFFVKVFSDSESADEGKLIGSLVANMMNSAKKEELYGYFFQDKELLGGVFFSRFIVDPSTKAFLLSPMAIHTDRQGQGLGQKLICHGVSQLKEMGVNILLTYGDPNYYSKVGFQQITEDMIKAPQPLQYPHGWLAQSLDGNEIPKFTSKTKCIDALNNPVYW